MKYLNHIQKVVLQSVKNGHSSIEHIQEDTLLPKVIILNTLQSLEAEQVIKKHNNLYLPLIHSEHRSLWKVHKDEVFSLIDSAYQVENHFHFKLAKFKKDDYLEYTHLCHRLNNFIKECNKRNQVPTKDQLYLFWGQVSQAQIASQFH